MPGVTPDMDLVLDKYLTVNEGKENARAMSPVPGRVATPVFDIKDGPSLQKTVHEAHSGSQEPSSRAWGVPSWTSSRTQVQLRHSP